ALQQPDAIERNAEPVAQQLRERGGMALAVIERAGDDGDGAVGLEADAAHLLVRRRRHFQVGADAEAAQPPALPGFALALPKTLPLGELDRVLEHGGKIAAVVDLIGNRLR